jgi:SNF2 family DNA or RNA helicase
MSFISYQCKVCQKNVTEISHFSLSGKCVRKLSCGHSQIDEVIVEKEKKEFEDLVSLKNKKLFPFQLTGARAAEKSNINFLFADEMGLGKTIEILATLKVHVAEALPAAIICKSSLKSQWSLDIAEWFGVETPRLQVESSKDIIPPKLPFYIFSFDILRRFAKKVKERNIQGELIAHDDYSKLTDLFTYIGIKTVVIDECQHIKNHQSTRSIAVREICKLAKYKLAASGTPIKNNASEYFPILNILKPELFKTYKGFIQDWCDAYWTGYSYKVSGIRDVEKFNQFTKDFIIRRTRDEVELDFPARNRSYHYFDLGEQVQKAYDATVEELSDYMYHNESHSFIAQQNILGYLNKMRHLTGLSKVDDVIDFIDDFLNSTDRQIVIFVHHIDVGDLIQQKCNKLMLNLNEMFGKNYPPCYRMFGGQAGKIFETGEKFKSDKRARVLIAPTLAAGEGLNLQTIGDCIIVEREWNPPNEEQAEGRFIRIGSTHSTVCVNYMLAIGTIDEKFTDIVEKKRALIASALDGKTYNWNETDIMKELAIEIVKAKNKKKV